MIGQGVITTSGVAPIEFARSIFEELGLFAPEKLDAWCRPLKTGDLACYGVLAR